MRCPELLLLVTAACGAATAPSRELEARVVPDPIVSEAGSPACGVPGSSADGWACRCDSDCQGGARCHSEQATGQAGGRCSRLCTGPADCGPRGTCVSFPGQTTGVCEPTCDTTADCPARAYCDHNPAPHLCTPLCQRDGDCESGHCNLYTGLCTDGTAPAGAGVYERCLRNEDCKSGLCSPSGFCIVGCSIALQRCPDGALCVSSNTQNEVGICLPRCTAQLACTVTGTSCKNVLNPAGEHACSK